VGQREYIIKMVNGFSGHMACTVESWLLITSKAGMLIY